MDVLNLINGKGWNLCMGHNSITISPPDQDTADFLLDKCHEKLARSAAILQSTVKIDWGGKVVYCITPDVISAQAADNSESAPTTPEISNIVFGNGLAFDVKALRILEQMQQSEKPMSICDLESDTQEWVNRPLSQMLRMDFQQALNLNIRDLWEEDALNYVKTMLHQQSVFNHSYEAFLPYGRAAFNSTFEVIEFGLIPNQSKRTKRLVTIHHYEPVSQMMTRS